MKLSMVGLLSGSLANLWHGLSSKQEKASTLRLCPD